MDNQAIHGVFDIMGPDLLSMVEEIRISGKVSVAINSTFIALIPKSSKPPSFEDYIPISLCNLTYKINVKIIAKRIKPILSRCMSREQFGFLGKPTDFDAIGVVQETFHSIKKRNLNGLIMQLDLSQAYNKLNWGFMRLTLMQIGLPWNVSRWIMGYNSSMNYAILINGSPNDFFLALRA